MTENTKNVSFKLPKALWKKVKILSVHNDSTVEIVIRDIIEKYVNTKKNENIINEDLV